MSMSDVNRRIMGHLSVPRTLDNLAARVATDPYLNASASDVQEALSTLVDAGYVVELGEAGTGEEAVAMAAKDGSAIELDDEQADNYARRIDERPDHADRIAGGSLYILTNDGLDAVRGPDPDTEDEEQ